VAQRAKKGLGLREGCRLLQRAVGQYAGRSTVFLYFEVSVVTFCYNIALYNPQKALNLAAKGLPQPL